MMGEDTCRDEIDNDGDDLIDCEDPECSGVAPCFIQAPALSPWALVIMSLCLLAIGAFGTLRVRRRA
jgi:hypothetical protein